MKILISLVISLITISVHADDVGYYTSKATIDNNDPFSDAVTVGDILYLSGIIGETNG